MGALGIHLHVGNADGEAKFTVRPVELIKNYGLKQKDINWRNQ